MLSFHSPLASILGFEDIRNLWQCIGDRPSPINYQGLGGCLDPVFLPPPSGRPGFDHIDILALRMNNPLQGSPLPKTSPSAIRGKRKYY